MAHHDLLSHIEHPLALGSFRNWLRLLRESDGVEAKYAARLLVVSLLTLFTSPLRLYERLRYDGELARTVLHPSPVFIAGHWRTGTTFLHQLLCQDAHLGYVSTFQALAPGFALISGRVLKPLLAWMVQGVHPTRVIDNIPLSFDAPQEDEFAMACMSPYAFLHGFTFPRQAAAFFERCVLFDGLPAQARAEWVEAYLALLRKATLASGGRRLVLKNPSNSARIRALLELFPQAKFIHMCRNPYDVFLSMMFVYQTVLPRAQVQSIGADQTEAYVLRFYAQLLQRYLADRTLIPPANLVEVRFEDLEAAPLGQVRRVYERLGLPGFAEAEPAFRAHVDSVAGYQKNQYALTGEVIRKVNQHWQFAFDEWGYMRL